MILMRKLNVWRKVPESSVKALLEQGFECVDGVDKVEIEEKVNKVKEVKMPEYDKEKRREELSYMTVKSLRELAEKYDKSLGANIRKDNLVSLIIKSELKALGKI